MQGVYCLHLGCDLASERYCQWDLTSHSPVRVTRNCLFDAYPPALQSNSMIVETDTCVDIPSILQAKHLFLLSTWPSPSHRSLVSGRPSLHTPDSPPSELILSCLPFTFLQVLAILPLIFRIKIMGQIIGQNTTTVAHQATNEARSLLFPSESRYHSGIHKPP